MGWRTVHHSVFIIGVPFCPETLYFLPFCSHTCLFISFFGLSFVITAQQAERSRVAVKVTWNRTGSGNLPCH